MLLDEHALRPCLAAVLARLLRPRRIRRRRIRRRRGSRRRGRGAQRGRQAHRRHQFALARRACGLDWLGPGRGGTLSAKGPRGLDLCRNRWRGRQRGRARLLRRRRGGRRLGCGLRHGRRCRRDLRAEAELLLVQRRLEAVDEHGLEAVRGQAPPSQFGAQLDDLQLFGLHHCLCWGVHVCDAKVCTGCSTLRLVPLQVLGLGPQYL